MTELYPHAHEHEWSDNQAWTAEVGVEAKPFRDMLTAVSSLVDEAVIRFTPDAVSVEAIDPARVAMVEARRECITSNDDILEVGLPVSDYPDDLPPYWNPSDEYKIEVNHSGVSEDSAEIRHETEGRNKTEAIDPAAIWAADETPPEPEYEHETTIQAPKVNGAFTGMAQAADSKVRLTPGAETLLFEGDNEDGEWEYDWKINVPDVGLGDPAVYSADYLRDITTGLWGTGEYTVRFGSELPLVLETDGLRFMQAPRVMD